MLRSYRLRSRARNTSSDVMETLAYPLHMLEVNGYMTSTDCLLALTMHPPEVPRMGAKTSGEPHESSYGGMRLVRLLPRNMDVHHS